jgi:hypothetical protein
MGLRYVAFPAHPAWPQRQTISILFAIPSQCALQYLLFSDAGQLQAAFAHFFGLSISLLHVCARGRLFLAHIRTMPKSKEKIAAVVLHFFVRFAKV